MLHVYLADCLLSNIIPKKKETNYLLRKKALIGQI